MNRNIVFAAAIAVAFVIVAACSSAFLSTWLKTPQVIELCLTSTGHFISESDNPERFSKCIAKNAEDFIKYDFAETKDLAKAFLTLLVAVFVASLTFSEKIVAPNASGWWAKLLMGSCWGLLLYAIIATGTALAFFGAGLWWAVHLPIMNYRSFEVGAVFLLASAGIAFGASLTAMFIAGVISMLHAKQEGA